MVTSKAQVMTTMDIDIIAALDAYQARTRLSKSAILRAAVIALLDKEMPEWRSKAASPSN